MSGVMRFRDWRIGFALFAFLIALSPDAGASATPASQSTFYSSAEGTVTDQLTGLPVAGASVTVAELGLSASTDANGYFTWREIPLAQETFPVTITVAAPGYGNW